MTGGRSSTGFFFAWAGLVLLPFNIIAGSLLSQKLGPESFLVALALGLGGIVLLGIPAVLIAQRTGWTFPSAAYECFPRPLASFLVTLAPGVNFGWYALQTAAAAQAVEAISGGAIPAGWSAVPLALLFAAGPLLFGFSWLSRTGALACFGVAAIMIWLLTGLSWDTPAGVESGAESSVLQGMLLILGTWVFSSTTGVMDLARFAASRRGALIAFVMGLTLADGCLIALGYALGVGAGSADMLGSFLSGGNWPGFLFLIAALWSTNDSNAYSTMMVLERLRLPLVPAMLLFALASGGAAALWEDHLYQAFGWWLQAMGWSGLVLGGLWWLVLGRQKLDPQKAAI